VLDFVDLSGVELATLPSLFGLPRALDLHGDDAGAAAERYEQLRLEFPDFEVPPDEITLEEIQSRAAAFDPLSLSVDSDVRAVSPNAWVSLGSRGLALHVLRGRKVRAYRVLIRARRGRRYAVEVDGRERARFSSLPEAVEAVDYEVGRLGPRVAATARPHAAWRRQPPPPAARAELRELTPERQAETWGEALRLLDYARFGPRARASA